jgi:hypothetical protein
MSQSSNNVEANLSKSNTLKNNQFLKLDHQRAVGLKYIKLVECSEGNKERNKESNKACAVLIGNPTATSSSFINMGINLSASSGDMLIKCYKFEDMECYENIRNFLDSLPEFYKK